jgi:YbbR domain-containing protein
MKVYKTIDDLLVSPWVLWAISVGVAVMMWFYVMDVAGAAGESREFVCQIGYRNLAPELGIRSMLREVTVEVEASERVMNRLEHDSILCEVDLRGFSWGRYREPIRTVLPPNVRLVSVRPSQVEIELLRMAGRLFAVNVALPQDIPSGQYLEAVEVVPKELSIRGTERDLAKIGSVSVAPTFEELRAGKELLLPVTIAQSEPFEDDITWEPVQVRLNATLVTGLPRKKVAVNVRLNGKPSGDYAVRTVTTDPAEVMIQGAQKQLDAISAIDTETVDITNLSADQAIVVPLRPFKEEDVSTMDVKSVKLSLQFAPISAQKQVSGVPIDIEGMDAESADKKKWAVSPAVVDVTVEASPSRIEMFDPEAAGLRVFVDISNIFLSRTTLPVRTVLVSDDFKVVKIDPSTVAVNVVE